LVRRTLPESEQIPFMRKYDVLVYETACFMCDFAMYSEDKKIYDLPPPLIPAQEHHDPAQTRNPAFELCYWRFGLDIASLWAEKLGGCPDAARWRSVRNALALPPIHNGLYIAHENCPDTFERFNDDHPSMLFGYGYIPCDVIDPDTMGRTADRALGCWKLDEAWGWDFALSAMTFTRLGRPKDALNVLMMDARKNSYVASGNNYQFSRSDLPLYLPGNGSLLLSLAMMLAGYGDKPERLPGFARDGAWHIEHEGIMPLPY
jgi:hypothetical protein